MRGLHVQIEVSVTTEGGEEREERVDALLNDAALAAVKTMIERVDELGHTKADHYRWWASKHH